ncbi:hypothetical protein NLX83_21460 [Allokutzneria sp. A3M-2-11 16]|uniref:hypothetical protein n=1 Tax=Allokutzneria sp. A3M-2-11 16 TaxID=2962043 RepID=UPI0020B7771B|nr:hypothetical protein [Allokutzneria sp. A3M-2-11 16]MCP3801837.1 hypothetical protein [Allokutzneria sp. A3M-2-11 16]
MIGEPEDGVLPDEIELKRVTVPAARRAVRAPVDRGDVVSEVCALLVLDPMHARDTEAVVSAILAAALRQPHHLVTANTWRAHLPTWVAPQMVGATVKRLVDAKVLLPTGRWVRCSDAAARNVGKPQPVYRLAPELADTA